MTRILYRTPVSLSTIQSIFEGGKIRDIAYRLSDPLTDLTTICSDVAAERFIHIRAVPEQKLRVIPNGIDIAEFIPNPEIRRHSRQELKLDDHFAWLAVGRLEAPKDYPCLLHAFAIVARRHPNAILLIAGQGSLRPDLENLANELGLSKLVRFLGLRKDIRGLMNAANAFVMSSAWEGMPIALLESSSTALPMVATDVGGNREVVIEGVNGFLAPPQSATALANSMLQMMELPDIVRRRMGEAGRRYVEEHYSLKCIVDAWETLYLELLRKKGLV
jgi:glycosyltransferase involved in cell wall biosynthesis